MTKGVLIVTSRPESPEQIDDYHRWYDETHFPEILAIDGFITARRLANVDGESFAAIYDVDDVEAAQGALTSAYAAGAMSPSVGVQQSPPPSVQWFTQLATPTD